MVNKFESYDQYKLLITGSDVVLIDFSATWCGPCKTISPIFESLESKHPHVKFYNVDVDEQPEIASDVGIRVMPTFIAFKDGKKLDNLVGANPQGLVELLATVSRA
ncbi:thioredoxin [Cryptococcus wingfieldii CBS 7118]|uniref:Thioredoxin n=1 Tax=Cryptococcus wingfieldii CBS 7118 TaxID=1295528 RepID=A0A1E3HH10_9TREE|nr:thioredoxin [Cryptococcus wingfieldii CBS 7118]ODN75627.1 thioredoxin [Cryptococcus wingfieldii CBS 7118]